MYSEVRTFLREKQAVTIVYLSITTVGNKTITLSQTHNIYTKKSSTSQFIPVLVFFLFFLNFFTLKWLKLVKWLCISIYNLNVDISESCEL